MAALRAAVMAERARGQGRGGWCALVGGPGACTHREGCGQCASRAGRAAVRRAAAYSALEGEVGRARRVGGPVRAGGRRDTALRVAAGVRGSVHRGVASACVCTWVRTRGRAWGAACARGEWVELERAAVAWRRRGQGGPGQVGGGPERCERGAGEGESGRACSGRVRGREQGGKREKEREKEKEEKKKERGKEIEKKRREKWKRRKGKEEEGASAPRRRPRTRSAMRGAWARVRGPGEGGHARR
ncbi:hypothetical protein PVAP13_1KG380610 [Panicum virgatum]|uniref:Uncharacterized protein n=1 Tax=Panicum virgatum TaxID=38727 RepID=A0A8T0XK18_PANVG|nr:hypothetical protein PVAP13_1KG380610 [Panicum virgatum]